MHISFVVWPKVTRFHSFYLLPPPVRRSERVRTTLQWHLDGSPRTRFNFPYHFVRVQFVVPFSAAQPMFDRQPLPPALCANSSSSSMRLVLIVFVYGAVFNVCAFVFRMCTWWRMIWSKWHTKDLRRLHCGIMAKNSSRKLWIKCARNVAQKHSTWWLHCCCCFAQQNAAGTGRKTQHSCVSS